MFTKAISNTKANLVCEYKQNSQDVANNRTNVTVTLKVVSTGYYLSGTSTCYLNGTRYSPFINIPSGGSQIIATQTYNIQHNADGTGRISVSGSCNIANGSFNASGSGSANLPTIPRASQPSLSKTTFGISEKITIYTNRKSSSFTHNIKLLFWSYNADLATGVGDSFVWDTTKNADGMYQKMINENTKEGTIRLETYSGGKKIGEKDTWFHAKIVDGNPIFTFYDYECIDDKTLKLTGNNKTAINGFSNVKVIISPENKAIAQKYATITKYKFVCGNKQIEVPYNETSVVELLLQQVDNLTMNVYAIDSRGNSTMITKTFDNFIEYKNVLITGLNADRQNGVETPTNLSYKGTFWNQNFGSVKNSIKNVKYEYKKTGDSEWILGTTPILPNVTETENFDFTGLIKGDLDSLGFTLSESFNIKVSVTDELSTYEKETILNTGKPNLAIAKEGIAIGSPYDKEAGGNIQGIFKVGDIFISTVNENPSIMYGGTWIEFGKGQVLVGVDESQEEFKTVEKTGGEKTHKLTLGELPARNMSAFRGSGNQSFGGFIGVAKVDGVVTYNTNTTNGQDQPHNNLQPYTTVYMWKKVL